jgi:hypothetical protein
VENLWMNGAFPVEAPTRIFFSRANPHVPRRAAVCAYFRPALRLPAVAACRRFSALPTTDSQFLTVPIAVHRFEESIAGKPYLIEVAPVAKDRWRAYIVRIPGVPTALMPFYGPTPDQAAGLLREWLTRAHERANAGVRRV